MTIKNCRLLKLNKKFMIVSYDFSSDKRRTKFSKFLEKYGRRIQYSVFEIKNSPRILENILTEVNLRYKPHFTNADSIVIIKMCEPCKEKVMKFGYAQNEDKEVVVFS